MVILMPVLGGRLSPLLDVAERFLLVQATAGREVSRRELSLEPADLVGRARDLAGLGAELVICGAVSWPLEELLGLLGVGVVPNTCGPAEEVLAAFLRGELAERFLLPGCTERAHAAASYRG